MGRFSGLQQIELELRRAREDAAAARSRLIALTAISDDDSLAELAGSRAQTELMAAIAQITACAQRARELLRDRAELVCG